MVRRVGWLFHEHQIDGADDEQERKDVVPMQMVALKHDVGNNGKDGQRDALLHNLQLYKAERSAVADEPKPVGWHLAAILEERNAPRENNHSEQWPVVANARLL